MAIGRSLRSSLHASRNLLESPDGSSCHYPHFCVEQSSLFALKGLWILAGGATTGKNASTLHPGRGAGWNLQPRKIRLTTTCPAPLPGRKLITTGIPVVPPPANFCCASGAKRKDVGNDKNCRRGISSIPNLCRNQCWKDCAPRIDARSSTYLAGICEMNQ